MNKSLIHRLLRATRLIRSIALLASTGLHTYAATPAEGLTSFDSLYSGSFVALTGSAKSAGGAGLVVPDIAGYDFRLLAGSSAVDCGIGIEPFTAQTPLVYGYTESGATTLTALEVSASDGKYFDLLGLDITMDGPSSGISGTIRLVGYRSGAAVSGAVLSKSVTAASNGGLLVNFDVSANANFVGITMFRIETDGAYTISGAIGVDNVNAINFRTANIPPVGAGELAVVGWSALTDTIRFAALADLEAGSQIRITDRGWTDSNTFTATQTGDGTVTWTLSADIPKGSVFSLFLGGSDQATTLQNQTAGASLTGDISLSGYTVSDPMIISGDGIFIYRNSESNPFFIFGFNNSAGTVDANGWNTAIGATLRDSLLPGGIGSQNALVDGVNAIGFPVQYDNVQYTGPTSMADAVTWLARIANRANWTGDNTGTTSSSIVNSISIGSANTAPVAAANTGSTLPEGGIDPVTAAELEFNDAEQPDSAITYAITALPVNGILMRNGAVLAVSSTFTQDDVNLNRISYAHDGGETTGDAFSFSVSDGAGGTVSAQAFSFSITPVDDALALASPATITFTSAPGGSLALDGLGGSTDAQGVALAVYFADDALNRINSDITFEDPYEAGAANSGLAINYVTSAGSRYVVIKSDSSEDNFWLQSLQLSDYGGNDITIEAFENGVSAGSVNLSVNTDPWYFTFDQDSGLTPSIFGNVDEIRISGQDGETIWLTVNDIQIAAPEVNEAPTDLALSNNSVNQSASVNAVVGTLTTADPDSADTHSYSLVTGAGSEGNDLFNISEALLRANDSSLLAAGNYGVRIQTDDGQGGTYSEAFVITVIDDIAPVITSAGSAAGTNGVAFNYTVTASGGAVVFGSGGLPDGLSIDSEGGEISGTPLQAGSFEVQITAADLAGNSDTNVLYLSIAKGEATVTLGNLNPVYDGTGKVAGAATTPPGLTVEIVYDGSAVPPTNAGTYEVIGTINDSNYAASATNTLIIAKALLGAKADDQSRAYGQPNPLLSGALTGAVAADNLSVTFSTTANQASLAGSYDIVPMVVDPLERLSNYDLTVTNGILTVTTVQPAIVLSAESTFVTIDEAPAPMDSLMLFSGSGFSSFADATLTVSSVANGGPDDLLSIVNEGNEAGQIGVVEQSVTFGGLPMATYSGGATGLSSLQVVFNSNADNAAIEALLRQLAFSVTTNEVTNVQREVELVFDDAQGGTSTPVTLAITLNYRPAPAIDRVATGTNIPVYVSFVRMLTNDIDFDGDTLSITEVADETPGGGTVTADENGVTYTPAPDFAGVDALHYTVSDGRSGRAVGTVNVHVLTEGLLVIEDAAREPAATNSSVTLAIMGAPLRSYRILASEDLLQWSEIGTATTSENGFIRYFDADAVIFPYRFYRTVYP